MMISGLRSRYTNQSSISGKGIILSIILPLSISAIICLYTCRIFSNPDILFSHLRQLQLSHNMFPSTILHRIQSTITLIFNIFQYMFPLSELTSAYNTIYSFFDGNAENQQLLHDMLCHLLFVTFHIQMGLGYIGIAFLMSEQKRKNMLIRMDVDSENNDKRESISNNEDDNTVSNGRNNHRLSKTNMTSNEDKNANKKYDTSRKFRRSAPNFILLTVLPYMFQIIVFGKRGRECLCEAFSSTVMNSLFIVLTYDIHHTNRQPEQICLHPSSRSHPQDSACIRTIRTRFTFVGLGERWERSHKSRCVCQ